jgi:hypothetical protein
MSVETLILLALFIVLPLIRRLMRATRPRNQPFPEPADRRAPGTLARTSPPELAVPPLLDTMPHAASDAMRLSARVPAPHTGGPVRIAPAPYRTMEQRTAVGLRTRRDLRRAIVLAAILGPCRANSFHRSAFDE